MYIPVDKLLKSRKREWSDRPVENQDSGRSTGLNDFCSDSDVVVKAESHRVTGLGMVSRWSNDRYRPLTVALGDSQGGIDGSTAAESSGQWGISIEVERQQLVVASATQDLVIRHVC